MDLFRKTMKPVEQVLKDAGVKKDEIDDVSLSSLVIDRKVADNSDRLSRWIYSNSQGSATPQGVL